MKKSDKSNSLNLGDKTKLVPVDVKKTYICPFCNKEFPKSEYNNGQTHNCKIFSDIMNKGYKNNKKNQITPLAHIFVMCQRKNLDFGDLCKKFYFYFTREAPDELVQFGIPNLFDHKEFYLFMSGILNCPIKNFFTSDKEIIDYLLSYSYDLFHDALDVGMSYDKFTQETTYTIEKEDSDDDTSTPMSVIFDQFKRVYLFVSVSKICEDSIDLYSLTFDFHYPHVIDEWRTFNATFTLYDDKIKKLYDEINEGYYWSTYTDATPFTDNRFMFIYQRLLHETQNTMLDWNKYDIMQSVRYETSFNNNEYVIEHGINYGSCIPSTEDDFRLLIRYKNNSSLIEFEYPCIPGRIKNAFGQDIPTPSDEETVAAYNAYTLLNKLTSIIDKQIQIVKINGNDRFEGLEERKINYTDVIVVNTTLHCRLNEHFIKPYKGLVDILKEDGKIEEYHTYVGYCAQCGTYQVFQNDFNDMLAHGKPLCRIIQINELDVESSKKKIPFRYKSQSVLYAMGYTVNAIDDLSTEERQVILDKAIQKKLVTVHDTMDFLNWLITTRSPDKKQSKAIIKWAEDMKFIKEKYGEDTVIIKSIQV